MSEEWNPDKESEKQRAQNTQRDAEIEKAIQDNNDELAAQQAEEEQHEQEKQNAAKAAASRAINTPSFNASEGDTINFNMAPPVNDTSDSVPSHENNPQFSFEPTPQTAPTGTPGDKKVETQDSNTTQPNAYSETLGSSTMSVDDLKKHAEMNNDGKGNSANNNIADENSTPGDRDDMQGIVATEEMFRARYVAQKFYLSDRCKNTWKECMAPFNEAKDPAEAIEELFWGFLQLGPKMAIAAMLHADDQEILRKQAAQHDKEEYDQQLLLMKGLSPADFHKYKCDWIFGSEELHSYLKEQLPDIPTDEYKYVDINKCNDKEKQLVREHIEKFIKENPYYKNMIENFTHREFAQDEINREAAGLSYALHHLKGKPKSIVSNPNRQAPEDVLDPTERIRRKGRATSGPFRKVKAQDTVSTRGKVRETTQELRDVKRQVRKNKDDARTIRNYKNPHSQTRQQNGRGQGIERN